MRSSSVSISYGVVIGAAHPQGSRQRAVPPSPLRPGRPANEHQGTRAERREFAGYPRGATVAPECHSGRGSDGIVLGMVSKGRLPAPSNTNYRGRTAARPSRRQRKGGWQERRIRIYEDKI